jgi:hypothetical protein
VNNLKPKNHQIEVHHLRTGVPQRLMEHSERTEIPNSRGKQTTVTYPLATRARLQMAPSDAYGEVQDLKGRYMLPKFHTV